MALLPSGYIYSTKNNHGAAYEVLGGVAIGISSATATGVNLMTSRRVVKDLAVKHGRVKPVRSSGNSAFNAIGTLGYGGGGTFAYEATDYMVMRLATTLNGSASTVLKFASAAPRARRYLRQKAWGAQTSSSFRAGRFNWNGITGQRHPWSVYPSGNNATFKSTTNNGTNSDDQAIFVTYMSVPGELVYMEGKANPTTDEYHALTQN